MDIFLTKAVQFLLSLSLIVLIHEFGHFLGARLTGTRVDKFYLFFNPWFSIFKKKHKDTEYGIGWLPLGGFVKISGMVDENMDKKQLAAPAQPWEYRSKKPWQKLIMITGGVIFNFILAWAIYTTTLLVWGEKYLAPESLPYGIAVDSMGESIGLKNGDYIVALDDKPLKSFDRLMYDMISGVEKITVKRNDKQVDIPVPETFASEIINTKNLNFVSIRFKNGTIDSIVPNSIAQQVGLQAGDVIEAIDSQSVVYFQEGMRLIREHKGSPMTLKIQRGSEEKWIANVLVPKDSSLGIIHTPASIDEEALYKTETYGVFSAIPAGFSKSVSVLVNYWGQLKIMFGGNVNVNENVGGLISMGKIFPEQWSWSRFLSLTAFLSLIIGLINILPIPALDGGHMVIILIEWITGKQLPIKVLNIIQTIGFVLLVAFMLYAQGLDILRIFR